MTRRTVLVTGAAGNLGRAVAAAFTRAGASLVLLDQDAAGLNRACRDLPDAVTFSVDLLQAQQVGEAVSQALARLGRIDAVCHLAGGFRMGEAVHETTARQWDFLLDLNARSLLHLANAVVPSLIAQGGGRIVTVGAAGAQRGAAGMGAYCAAKSAVLRLTEAMSAELRDHGINVNCVLPSIIDTPENRAAMPDADFSRWVSPEALADVVVFLASDAARAIHGAALPVTGRT